MNIPDETMSKSTPWLLERYVAGELDSEQAQALERELAGSPELQAKVRELTAQRDAFLVAHPPAKVWRRIEGAPARRRWPWWSGLVVTACAACAVLFLMIPRGDNDTSTVRMKGGFELRLYASRPEGVVQLGAGARVPLGAPVKFMVDAPRSGFLSVIAIDSVGTPSVLFPAGAAPQEILLGTFDPHFSVAFDEPSGVQRVFAVLTESPLPTAEIRRLVAATRGDSATPSFPGLVTRFDLQTIDASAGPP